MAIWRCFLGDHYFDPSTQDHADYELGHCGDCIDNQHGTESAEDDSQEVLTQAVRRFTKSWFAKYARSTGGDV